MGWKCTPQITGLVRGEPSKTAKHRSNIRAILGEMGSERVSRSGTLDRSRSDKNRYTGYDSGFQCADEMTRKADAYRIKCTGKGGAEVERKLRADAVIGAAVIFNPPEEVSKNWTDEQYSKFYSDSMDFMSKSCPSIFRSENMRMSAEHFDEGSGAEPDKISRHLHGVFDCVDENGKYCGNLIDSKFFDTVNREYPAFMRSRGWDMDDLDVTDWKRAKEDRKYRKERDVKRGKSGLAVNEYITEDLLDQAEKNEELHRQLAATLQAAGADREAARKEREDAEVSREQHSRQMKQARDEIAVKANRLNRMNEEAEIKAQRAAGAISEAQKREAQYRAALEQNVALRGKYEATEAELEALKAEYEYAIQGLEDKKLVQYMKSKTLTITMNGVRTVASLYEMYERDVLVPERKAQAAREQKAAEAKWKQRMTEQEFDSISRQYEQQYSWKNGGPEYQ